MFPPDSDKMFPAFGFGAQVPPDYKVTEYSASITQHALCQAERLEWLNYTLLTSFPRKLFEICVCFFHRLEIFKTAN